MQVIQSSNSIKNDLSNKQQKTRLSINEFRLNLRKQVEKKIIGKDANALLKHIKKSLPFAHDKNKKKNRLKSEGLESKNQYLSFQMTTKSTSFFTFRQNHPKTQSLLTNRTAHSRTPLKANFKIRIQSQRKLPQTQKDNQEKSQKMNKQIDEYPLELMARKLQWSGKQFRPQVKYTLPKYKELTKMTPISMKSSSWMNINMLKLDGWIYKQTQQIPDF